MFFIEAKRSNIQKAEITFFIFSAVFVFCKVNILLFLSLLNLIIASVGRWVGGSVVSRFNKNQCFYI